MKALIQRVRGAKVEVEGAIIGQIESGLLVLLGVTHDDQVENMKKLADKLVSLRIFEDGQGKMNRSVGESGGSILVVSQFTLYGDCRKGNRPSFIQAAEPKRANALYELFIKELKLRGLKVESGSFGADMQVSLTNDGPVTFMLEF